MMHAPSRRRVDNGFDLLTRFGGSGTQNHGQRRRRRQPVVDPDRDAELLRGFDVDPASLVEGFSGQSPEVG
jgi:hypothetical protein